jgi:hypothetical protein
MYQLQPMDSEMQVTPDQVEVGSDLFQIGRTCDGQPFIAVSYYVMITNNRGDRWEHDTRWPSAIAHVDEEGYQHFENVDADAQAAAEKLAQRVRERGVIDAQYWNAMRPEYGSAAYIEYGQADDLAWELEQE